jgi:hypothetical protein
LTLPPYCAPSRWTSLFKPFKGYWRLQALWRPAVA